MCRERLRRASDMTPNAYALIGLTAIVASMVGVLRFAVAARDARENSRGGGLEMALMSAALQEAVGKLKAQERATAARAEASERLSEEIIASLTAGLLVTGLSGEVRILNPAGRRMLDLPDSATFEDIGRALDELSLSEVVRECLSTGNAIVRRTVKFEEPRHGVTHLGVTVSPLSDVTSAVHGAICLFTDLTAVKDLEEQLRLKDGLAAVGELTAGIAHEFRNG